MVETTKARERNKRYSRALPSSGIPVQIPDAWSELAPQPVEVHEEAYLEILQKHGLPLACPVPLLGRYSKPRRWSAEELHACVRAFHRGVPIGQMSAALNRNPQDIIFRLLDELDDAAGKFGQGTVRNGEKWSEQKLAAARELFEAGLTAWRIAALFGVDFEGMEKTLYKGRSGYGHTKKNPFAVCSDHKQRVNEELLGKIQKVDRALDAFAGEGRFSETLVTHFPEAKVICIEKDEETFNRAIHDRSWTNNVHWLHADNLTVLRTLCAEKKTFDLIDLDPFASCREQLDLIWPLLSEHASLFITLGGEYRRCFISTNRTAIARRYGFRNDSLSNQEYLEIVPSFFLGWVASIAAANGFILTLDYSVRYPNLCRFWLKADQVGQKRAADWLGGIVEQGSGGARWKSLSIPRFSEVRDRSVQHGRTQVQARRTRAPQDRHASQFELEL